MNFSSKLLENAVNEFSSLPGIGQKTALRLVLHLLNQPQAEVEKFSNSLLILKRDIRYCNECHNISDHELCQICSSVKRDKSLICVVEDTRDVMAIEDTGQYRGLYHVLGGVISPIEGIGWQIAQFGTQTYAGVKADDVVRDVARGLRMIGMVALPDSLHLQAHVH